MRPLVVEARIAALAPPGGHPVVVVPRRRRRRRWRPLDAEEALAAVASAGAGAVVAARPAVADPGAACLAAAARVLGVPVVRLPDVEHRAVWVLAVAAAAAVADERILRSLEALASAAVGPATAAAIDEAPALRPGVLARWACRAWRPCGSCRGGGLPGAPCGRCGAAVPGGRR